MMRQRRTTERIIFHHSLSADVSAYWIDLWHKDRGFTCIGYHYVIRADGTLEHGRDISDIGAHTYRRNLDSIGVCLTGDFSKRLATPEQIDRACAIYAELCEIYNARLAIEYHRPADHPQACPGRLLPRYFFEQMLHGAIRN